MTIKFSTALRNQLLQGDCFKKIFADCVLKIFSGSVPATADAQETGNLLCTVSKSSGTVTAADVSIAKQAYLNITTADAGSTLTPTLNSTAQAFTTAAGGNLATRVAQLAVQIEAFYPEIKCIATGATTGDGSMIFQSKIPGLTFTLTIAATGSGATANPVAHDALVDGTVVANSRSDALEFGAVSAGVISKAVETWSGTNAASGTAGYFRIVQVAPTYDDGTPVTVTQPRIQGSVGISGSDLNLNSVEFTINATTTISDGSITIPVSA